MKKLKKITTKALTVSALSLMLVSQSNAQTSIEACQTLPKAMESNISSWKNISAKGNSIIDQIDKLASNVNGILKIEADLKRMDKQLGDAKKLFDTFVPIVTPVSSVKKRFQTCLRHLRKHQNEGRFASQRHSHQDCNPIGH